MMLPYTNVSRGPGLLALCAAAMVAVLWVSSSFSPPPAESSRVGRAEYLGRVPVSVTGDSLSVFIYTVDGCEYIGIGLGTPEGVFTLKGVCR